MSIYKWFILLLFSLGTVTLFAQQPVLELDLNSQQIKKKVVKPIIGELSCRLEKEALAIDSCLILKGKSSIALTGDLKKILPTEQFTVEAFVAIQKPQAWATIIGYFQDNGSYEKGWLLGYRKNHFMFQLSTGPKLITVTSAPYKLNQWYAVAASYDGKTMKLYIDGKLVGSSTSASGKIDYPPQGFLTVGAYRDKNEFYRTHSMIRKIRLYHTVLSAEEIKAGLLKKIPIPTAADLVDFLPLAFTTTPLIKFTSRTTALLRWNSKAVGEYTVKYGKKNQITNTAKVTKYQGGYEAQLTGLKNHQDYFYIISCKNAKRKIDSKTMSLEMNQNYVQPKLSEISRVGVGGSSTKLIKKIIKDAGFNTGTALVYGLKDAKLLTALLANSNFQIMGVDDEESRIHRLRQMLYKQKIYGKRINLKYVKDLTKLPFVGNSFNLIISERNLNNSKLIKNSNELSRLLCPGERSALLLLHLNRSSVAALLQSPRLNRDKNNQGLVIRKTRRTGIGSWTHQYATPGNTAYGGETLAGASRSSELQTQWFGLPGADFGLDRNPRMPAPLAANGRLFHQGMNRIIALDSNNGVILWTLEFPDLRRTNMPQDAANWCCDNHNIYVVIRDQLWKIDSETGSKKIIIKLPTTKKNSEWGYIAQAGELLYGSVEKKNSSYRSYWGTDSWFDKISGENNNKVCSEEFFALNKANGKKRWSYSNGLIVNTSIVLDDKNIFFIESRNPKIKKLASSRIPTKALWKDVYIVSLNAKTGKKRWEHPLNIVRPDTVLYGLLSDNHLILCSSAPDTKNKKTGNYHLYCYDGTTGRQLWKNSHTWTRTNHSGHLQHPTIVDNRIYLKPQSYNLKSGKVIDKKIGAGNQCSTYFASKYALFYRRSAITMWGIKSKQMSRWSKLRQSCWISTIVADGMVLSPEGGGGCSCGRWIETSVAFSPIEKDQ
jgi:outer membrane protein assembly factor BamB